MSDDDDSLADNNVKIEVHGTDDMELFDLHKDDFTEKSGNDIDVMLPRGDDEVALPKAKPQKESKEHVADFPRPNQFELTDVELKATKLIIQLTRIVHLMTGIGSLLILLYLISRAYFNNIYGLFSDLFQLDNVMIMVLIAFFLVSVLERIARSCGFCVGPVFYTGNLLVQLLLPSWFVALILSLPIVKPSDEHWIDVLELLAPTFGSLNVSGGFIAYMLVLNRHNPAFFNIIKGRQWRNMLVLYILVPALYCVVALLADTALHLPPYGFVDFSTVNGAFTFIAILFVVNTLVNASIQATALVKEWISIHFTRPARSDF